ncbi:protein SIEVE ELEMENT OCCLUSION B-like [Neltuma alba]|uniref:protein SIEVE ELEMENT OCCLUSION B-like n=1 Tax=Neltuma alba TaxID=207710 RepID=UPI0010A470C9|nr:protein SIEVE ELEMENT OCCLUSION B-like [Prosopis alba]
MAVEIVGRLIGQTRSTSIGLTKPVAYKCAFALDFGETRRLALMERTKENALELHIFRLGEEPKPSKNNLDLITFKLIEGISTLEKKIAEKSQSPNLYNAPRELYTYWAILALLTHFIVFGKFYYLMCLFSNAYRDWNIKSEVVRKLNRVVMRLTNELNEIAHDEVGRIDRNWREDVFKSPSGIVDLLTALIFAEEITELEIFDNTTQQVVSNDVLKTKNVLLFISGLDNIEDEIWVLKSIHDVFKKDREKQNYEILWVPVVEETNDHKISDDQKEKFKHLKSNMPWYVLQNLFVIKGKKVLEELWHYQGKPIVVIINPRGQVIHNNAMHMIFVWKIEAFPFRPEDEERLSLH